MSSFQVAVTDDRFDIGYDLERGILREAGAELRLLELRTDDDGIRELAEVDAVLNNHYTVSAAVVQGMRRCRVVSRYGTGFDSVDVGAATRAGIWVANVPDYATEDVSDHAMALLLGCVRKVVYRDRRIREGAWYVFSEQRCYRMRGKTLGIVGYGRIGRAFHRKIAGFGLAEVLVHDPYVDPALVRSLGATPAGLEDLLGRSDYLTIHAALTDETRGMIDARRIALLKTSAILVNTARGPIVDQDALTRAAQAGSICYCGLDVFAQEPLEADHPLRRLDNVILSDHAAWYTEESQVEMRAKAARNVAEVLQGRKPTYPVNQVPGRA
jgi:D-3-phosphoglycerate dehydrogenase / 2-oxoglutarate reductase